MKKLIFYFLVYYNNMPLILFLIFISDSFCVSTLAYTNLFGIKKVFTCKYFVRDAQSFFSHYIIFCSSCLILWLQKIIIFWPQSYSFLNSRFGCSWDDVINSVFLACMNRYAKTVQPITSSRPTNYWAKNAAH